MEAVYYCVEEGVNPKMQNENDEDKDAFRYGVENNRIEMLKMMIESY